MNATANAARVPRIAFAARWWRYTQRAALLGTAWLAAGVVGQAGENPAPRRPNILFVLADDLGCSDLSHDERIGWGSHFYRTPNLDALARSGVRFTDAYAACPVCSPTRAAILTGKYPARMDTTDWFGGRRKGPLLPAPYVDRLPLEEVTLAEALREAGYRTGFFGKWHLGGEGFGPREQGFDVNVGGHHRGSPPGGYFAPYRNPELADGPDGEHLPERLATEVIAFTRDCKERERPFLAYLSFYSVHTPLQARKQTIAKYRARANSMPQLPFERRWAMDDPRYTRQVHDHAVYAAMIEHMDAQIGRVLTALDTDGLARDTVVLFTSDNGGLSTSEGSPTSNTPFRAGKGWLYEGGIRVPLIVRWPGVTKAGAVYPDPVISTDYYPTILAMAGLDQRPEQHVDGVDLTALLRTGRSLPDRALFWHYPHYGNQGGTPGSVIRRGSKKLLRLYRNPEGIALESFEEYYDLADNRAEVPGPYGGSAQSMSTELTDWLREVDAKMPSVNPKFDPAAWQKFHRRQNGPALREKR